MREVEGSPGVQGRLDIPSFGPDVHPSPDPLTRRHRDRSRGVLTVLVAEDEPGVRGPVRRILVAHGFHVLEANDGEEALVVADRHDGTIDLLLTDVVMPNMGGAELARRLRTRRPDLKILFMTGYSAEAVASHGVLAPDSSLLQKPFTAEELVRRVREILPDAS
jgi:two-component system cell cycle sensor histidine kinase/response regulator CckA